MELYCASLLKHGKVIKGAIPLLKEISLPCLAMRVAQRHRVTSLRANQFLEAALDTNKEEIIVAVKRFLTEQNIL